MLQYRLVFCVLVASLSICSTAIAEQFSYGVDQPANLPNERFTGDRCYVIVHGPSGGSNVGGVYDNADGTLLISVDRFSHLSIRGSARKVIVMYVNSHCSVDLTEVKIGSGGVEIHSVDGRSHVDFGHCDGLVKIQSVDDGSVIRLRAGTKVDGKNKFHGSSELYFDEASGSAQSSRATP